jgi:hypothetical protein
MPPAGGTIRTRIQQAALVYLPALSHSGLFCVARQRGNWPQPQNGPKLPVRFTVSEPHTHSPATSSVALSPDK